MSRDVEYSFSALRIVQRADAPLYVFGVDGRLIHQFAAVNFAERARDGVLSGYQRDRVSSHIAQIRAYIAQEDALLPNAIVVAFDEQVSFRPLPHAVNSAWGTPGVLKVPLPEPGARKAGLIVDGQQRVSAMASLPASRRLPVVVVSFASNSAELQTEQFVLVNKTKPLPRDLINELLPHVGAERLPAAWTLRRDASQVLETLRFSRVSPFFARIRGVGSNGEGYNMSQAAILATITASMRRKGVLADLYELLEPGERPEEMARLVAVFYSGVAAVWPNAWSGSPWTSRLVHGVGIAGTGALMDVIMSEVDYRRPRAVASVARRLAKIKDRCAWTAGRWPRPLACAWDALQNTSQDKRRLAAYLVDEYSKRR